MIGNFPKYQMRGAFISLAVCGLTGVFLACGSDQSPGGPGISVDAGNEIPDTGLPGQGPDGNAPDASTPDSNAPDASGSGHTVTYDDYSLMVDGKRIYIWSGEFHYWRLPSPDLWRDILQKMRAAGFNAASIYFHWGFHSPKKGVYDFTGVRDVEKLLNIAAEVGIYVIARPGPYINAETDSGGFPAWLTTEPGKARSTAADYLANVDEWLSQIDPILARHQLTNGTGTVILDQVENEFYDNSDPARQYMVHLEQKIRGDGITVPLTGNHRGAFNSGVGALDIDGPDAYPLGFDCSMPTTWKSFGDISYDHPAGKPLYAPEFQGGSFSHWGGPTFDQCRQLTGPDFEKVYYKNNIAVGATMQSFYMTYGGTTWGWLAGPSNVYTSYDYGAPIQESRELGGKYDEDKRIGYFTHAVTSLAKTDAFAVPAPDSAAVTDTARINPDDGAQFHVLRHTDPTATATDSAHISLDLDAHSGYSVDDADSALAFAGTGWAHAGREAKDTFRAYHNTESTSAVTNDSVTISFTGTQVRWIGTKDTNRGMADVYIDGTKVTTVDEYAALRSFQQILYSATGLVDVAHTLKIVVTGQKNSLAKDVKVGVDAIDLPGPTRAYYPTVPQQSSTSITLAGRDSKMVVAHYKIGDQDLRYSTSEIMTHARIGARDVALLYGRAGEDGETVLHAGTMPAVTVLAGNVQNTWDSARGDLRLNYKHSGLAAVLVSGGPTPLLLLLATDEVAATFWQQSTQAGPVLVRGPSLLRTAAGQGSTLALTGDTDQTSDLEVFAPSAFTAVTWNGTSVSTTATNLGSRLATLPGPVTVSLPALANWKYAPESQEAQPGFDDSSWRVADRTTSASITTPVTLPVLFADDYGFHHGDVWYRGHFNATGTETDVKLSANTGPNGQWSAWLNGIFLGSSFTGSTGATTSDFTFPSGALHANADNVISVLVENMGHLDDFKSNDSYKQARGLSGAVIMGSAASDAGASDAGVATARWLIQGALGGEDLHDVVRGPMNNGGLFGERNGWSLAGFDDQNWTAVPLPDSRATAGIGWYRTIVHLDLPSGQDTSVGLRIDDDPKRHYRAEIFINGWQLGRYVNDLGPQHSFPIPNGILRPRGDNTIAIAVWNADATSGGLGTIQLESYGTHLSPLQVSDMGF